MWRKRSHAEAEERSRRADQAVAQSEREATQVEELRRFVSGTMAYLARLNQENSFATKMAAAYSAQTPRKGFK